MCGLSDDMLLVLGICIYHTGLGLNPKTQLPAKPLVCTYPSMTLLPLLMTSTIPLFSNHLTNWLKVFTPVSLKWNLLQAQQPISLAAIARMRVMCTTCTSSRLC